ncbi:MAG TPA: S53 family peptidase [Conexibacter sp.]|jgi:subtilase family serine protease|nr:S53 family peptidase [Conexibacter sp.]
MRTRILACCAAALAALTAFSASAFGKPHRAVCSTAVAAAVAHCQASVVVDAAGKPAAAVAPAGYGPAQFHAAYALPATAPVAQTIAIVDAYDDPTVASDLNAYDATFGLPACTTANGCFRKVNQNGVAGSYPSKSAGWALEIALDVETAHAICQNCKILLVEASSASFASLEASVGTAARLGATEISNSYGGSEFSGETADTAYKHPGIAVTVAAGDNGYGSFGFPAASPYVVAVGGTTLTLGSGGAWAGETAWSGGGSGCSGYLLAQSWQTSDANWSLTGCGTKRGVADVAADADPSTGAAVYDTTRYGGRSGWFQVGGTSLSSPLVAGVYALAGNAASKAYPASLAYANRAALHDVTAGSTGSCTTLMCVAGAGYDGPTGVGSPIGLGAF